MTTDEKILLVQLGQLANELNTLTQLGMWSFNGAEPIEGTNIPEQVTRYARFAQAFFMLRLLASRLWEGWATTVQRSFFRSQLSRTYEPLLSAHAQAALGTLKRILSHGGPLETVRNQFGFHNDRTAIKDCLHRLDSGEVLDLFIAPYSTYSNSFSPLSDRVMNVALQGQPDFDDPANALNHLLEEAAEANHAFQDFIWGWVAAACKRHNLTPRTEEFVLDEPPEFMSIQVPYFTLAPTRKEMREWLDG